MWSLKVVFIFKLFGYLIHCIMNWIAIFDLYLNIRNPLFIALKVQVNKSYSIWLLLLREITSELTNIW